MPTKTPLHIVKLDLTPTQIKKLRKGQHVQLKHHHIGRGHPVHMTLTKAKAFHKAHLEGRGKRLHLTHHELHASGLWDEIKKGASWLWNTVGKPVASAGLNALESTVGDLVPLVGKPLAAAGRQFIRAKTGLGVKKAHLIKGSVEAREHMAKLRAMRKTKAHGGALSAMGY